MQADAIYVGGGNTQKMIRVWKETGTDIYLKQAYEKGIVLSGVSAGAICWFRWGNSDSRKFHNPDADMIKVSGLNLIKALYCPHYDAEIKRRASFKKMMIKTPGIGLAVDNCCAIEIIDKKYRILSSKPAQTAGKIADEITPFHFKKLPSYILLMY